MCQRGSVMCNLVARAAELGTPYTGDSARGKGALRRAAISVWPPLMWVMHNNRDNLTCVGRCTEAVLRAAWPTTRQGVGQEMAQLGLRGCGEGGGVDRSAGFIGGSIEPLFVDQVMLNQHLNQNQYHNQHL